MLGQADTTSKGAVSDAVFSTVATSVDDLGHRYPAGRHHHLRIPCADQGYPRIADGGRRGSLGAGFLWVSARESDRAELADDHVAAVYRVRADRGFRSRN